VLRKHIARRGLLLLRRQSLRKHISTSSRTNPHHAPCPRSAPGTSSARSAQTRTRGGRHGRSSRRSCSKMRMSMHRVRQANIQARKQASNTASQQHKQQLATAHEQLRSAAASGPGANVVVHVAAEVGQNSESGPARTSISVSALVSSRPPGHSTAMSTPSAAPAPVPAPAHAPVPARAPAHAPAAAPAYALPASESDTSSESESASEPESAAPPSEAAESPAWRSIRRESTACTASCNEKPSLPSTNSAAPELSFCAGPGYPTLVKEASGVQASLDESSHRGRCTLFCPARFSARSA